MDVSDNLGCRDSKNQDAVVDKFTMIQEINGKISKLEVRKIEATKLLRSLYKNLNSAEKALLEYRLHEYEEELSSRLLTLIKRKDTIKKQCAGEIVASITEKINNKLEEIKQSIQDNTLLNDHYVCELQMLQKEQRCDAIIDIYCEDRIKYLEEQIKNCEEEDIILHDDLQTLEAQQAKDYMEESLVDEKIFQLVRPLNIEYVKILQEEDELAIMHQHQQELYHIKDQIKLQESLIENLKCELNSLNQELENILHLTNNNLSLHDELSYWNERLNKDVEYDITAQLSSWIRSNHHINVGNLPNSFIGNDRDKNQVLDDSLCDFQGTLSLWNLLMRKKYGVYYNHQHDIMQSEEVNTEYAHRLAYKTYASIYDTSQENIELSGISMVD